MLIELRAAVVEAVRKALPGLATCEARAGRFVLEELQNLGARLPAAMVTVLGWPGSSKSDGRQRLVAEAQVVVYLVAGEARQAPAGDAAMRMAEQVAALAYRTDWLPAEVGEPEEIAAENLHVPALRKTATCIWAVRWTQSVPLGPPREEALEFLPEELYVGIAPEIGAAHEEDYQRVVPPEELP